MSWRFDSRVSPSAGHQLQGCLATTGTGLSPTSPPQLPGHKTDRSRIVATGHAFIQNLRRGRYELATDATTLDRVAVALTELALAI